jgi:hypothetical protein
MTEARSGVKLIAVFARYSNELKLTREANRKITRLFVRA